MGPILLMCFNVFCANQFKKHEKRDRKSERVVQNEFEELALIFIITWEKIHVDHFPWYISCKGQNCPSQPSGNGWRWKMGNHIQRVDQYSTS